MRELLNRRELHALRLIRDDLPLGPPCRRDAALQVGERLVQLGLVDTNSFNTKRSSEIWRIYTKLSHSQALIPPAVGLILDRDGR